jgi:hypothetical protein
MRAALFLPRLVVAAAVVATFSGCGTTQLGDGSFADGTPISSADQDAVVAEVRAAGQPAYYLGSTIDDLPLTLLDLVEENAPSFDVEADYGTCRSFGDGGCSAPIVVSTNDRRPDVPGTHCRRLQPQLGVPAGVLMGELTLVTGGVVVTVSDFRNRGAPDDVQTALRLLPALQAVGAAQPVSALPAPTAESSAWIDEACGTEPGHEVSHPMEGGTDAVTNSQVPDFTVERLGGGELRWADYRGKPVVIAVGTVAQVSSALRRLRPQIPSSPSRPIVMGLVIDPTADKFHPRPIADIERQAGSVPAPVGYAAVLLPAVWFLDAAGNTGTQSAWDEGIIAFVDGSGSVTRFVSASTPDAQLSELTRDLG